MNFCKKMFLSMCSFAIGFMFSAKAQDQALQNYLMRCFPTPLNGKIVTICLGKNEEEGEEIEEDESGFATFDEDGFIIFKRGNVQEGENGIFADDRDEMWTEWEGDLIAPSQIRIFQRSGKVKPVCDSIGLGRKQ